MSDNKAKIAELERQIAELRQADLAAMEARRQLVKPSYVFTLEPVHTTGYRKSADPHCCWYRLTGTVTNKPELEEVGIHPFEGGMDYLFNELSGRFVISGGGGSVWLHLTPHYGEESDDAAFKELEAFIKGSPLGGEVTEIVNRYRENR